MESFALDVVADGAKDAVGVASVEAADDASGCGVWPHGVEAGWLDLPNEDEFFASMLFGELDGPIDGSDALAVVFITEGDEVRLDGSFEAYADDASPCAFGALGHEAWVVSCAGDDAEGGLAAGLAHAWLGRCWA